MIELKSDGLVVSFPEKPFQPVLHIDFLRTLRIPDDGKTYPLPPGFGYFPLVHVDDHARRVPSEWLDRGGVIARRRDRRDHVVRSPPCGTPGWLLRGPFRAGMAGGLAEQGPAARWP